jgi:hypothetical protein
MKKDNILDTLLKTSMFLFFIILTSAILHSVFNKVAEKKEVTIYMENIDANWNSTQLMGKDKDWEEYVEAFDDAILNKKTLTGYKIYKGEKVVYSKQFTAKSYAID